MRTKQTAKKSTGSRPPQPAELANSRFHENALPLHVNITHTPPVLGDNVRDAAQADPGFIGSSTLVPVTFVDIGRFGWKGTKRTTVEIVDRDTGDRRMAEVLIAVNAIVLKDSPSDLDEVHAAGDMEELQWAQREDM